MTDQTPDQTTLSVNVGNMLASHARLVTALSETDVTEGKNELITWTRNVTEVLTSLAEEHVAEPLNHQPAEQTRSP